MKLSTKSRYGTRAMLDIALHNNETPIAMKDIAERQEISVQYLEQLIQPLRTARLVKSTRGARGGIALLKPPSKIKLGDIVTAMEGEVSLVDCVDHPEACPRAASCITRDVWRELQEKILEYLNSITLQDLVHRWLQNY